MSEEYDTNVIDLVQLYNSSDVNFWFNITQCVSLIQSKLKFSESEVNKSSDESTINYCLKEAIGSSPYIPARSVQLFWGTLHGLMIAAAVVGNSMVIWIILAHKRMRTVTNLFLLNLAIADLMMALFNASFNFVYMLNSHWPFGSFYCTVNNFLASLTVFASVFTITAMSIDRYVAIVLPLKPRMSRKTANKLLALIWFLAFIISTPNFLYSTVFSYRYPDGQIRTVCILVWPDGIAGVSYSDYVYNIVFFVVTYVIPMITLTITYTWMSTVLWKSKSIGEVTELQKNSVKAKKNVVKMLIAVVSLFAICWLPYHLYFLYIYHFPNTVHQQYIQHIYLAFYWFAMSNSVYNPIIYYIMNDRFRRYFQTFLCCCKTLIVRTQQPPLSTNIQMRTLQVTRRSFATTTATAINSMSPSMTAINRNSSVDLDAI